MREIKFRGYAVEEMVNSQWVEGFGVYEIKLAEHYVKEVGRDSDWVLYTYSGDYRVDPKSIGQYTGLKDKNGKEIYEGDIVRNGRGTLLKVFFDNGCFVTEGIDALSGDPVFRSLVTFANWSEVIGNIYENPSLLEESE
ncbi:YopX family protein [Heyndrickxia sp. FSL W8-0496]|uniref:YopX family protein n=1 Tax=Heyndrickxia sp. FSL W8-0496 TaxID=2954702 RepID=UPI0030FBBC0C